MALTLVHAKTWPSGQMKTIPYRSNEARVTADFSRCQEVQDT